MLKWLDSDGSEEKNQVVNVQKRKLTKDLLYKQQSVAADGLRTTALFCRLSLTAASYSTAEI